MRVTGIYSLFLVRLFVYFCLVLLSLTQASYKDLTQKWFVLDPTLVLVAIPDKSSLNHGKLLSVAPLMHTTAAVDPKARRQLFVTVCR